MKCSPLVHTESVRTGLLVSFLSDDFPGLGVQGELAVDVRVAPLVLVRSAELLLHGAVVGSRCGWGRMAAVVGGTGRLQFLEGQKAAVVGGAGRLQL